MRGAAWTFLNVPDGDFTPAGLWEYRLRELEKRVDTMQTTLATKEDVQRLSVVVADIRDNQRTRDEHTFDIRKTLWPPLLVGVILSVVNWLITVHPK